jgi:alpha-beta hydrolase superfamily lysophospholipase
MTVLGVVVGAWVLLTGALWLTQRQLVYLPDRDLAAPPGDVTVRTVETPDGISHRVWVVPAAGEPRARVLVFNGNAGNKGHRLPLARNLAAEGLEVILFDYRGYGDTGGSPSEEGLLTDAEAVAEIAFDTDLPVVYFGESLGAGVATGLAIRRPPDAMVLRSPFTSLADMARAHYLFVPTFLIRDRYPVEDQGKALEVPVLVVLGTSDTIVPPALSRRVFDAATGPKDMVEMEGLDHNDSGLSSSAELATAVVEFLEKSGVVAAPGSQASGA